MKADAYKVVVPSRPKVEDKKDDAAEKADATEKADGETEAEGRMEDDKVNK